MAKKNKTPLPKYTKHKGETEIFKTDLNADELVSVLFSKPKPKSQAKHNGKTP